MWRGLCQDNVCKGGLCGPGAVGLCLVTKTAHCTTTQSDKASWQTVAIQGSGNARWVYVGFGNNEPGASAVTLKLDVEAPVTPNPFMGADVSPADDCSSPTPADFTSGGNSSSVSFAISPGTTYAVRLFLAPDVLPGVTELTVSVGALCLGAVPVR